MCCRTGIFQCFRHPLSFNVTPDEFHLRPGDLFQNVLQRTHAMTNNETYATPWYDTPVAELAREAGFSKVSIVPFERMNRSVVRPGKAPINGNYWNLYTFQK